MEFVDLLELNTAWLVYVDVLKLDLLFWLV